LPKLIETITLQHKPDVAALQEVDAGHWDDAIEKALVDAGYDALYTRKNPEKKGGHGIATIWRRDL
jgi:mRNA deadenylase 3'-5' endonuclease subunit Ccr4